MQDLYRVLYILVISQYSIFGELLFLFTCFNIKSLELISAGFVESVVHSSHKPVFNPW